MILIYISPESELSPYLQSKEANSVMLMPQSQIIMSLHFLKSWKFEQKGSHHCNSFDWANSELWTSCTCPTYQFVRSYSFRRDCSNSISQTRFKLLISGNQSSPKKSPFMLVYQEGKLFQASQNDGEPILVMILVYFICLPIYFESLSPKRMLFGVSRIFI